MRFESFSPVVGVSRIESVALRAFAELAHGIPPAHVPDVLIVAGDTARESVDALFTSCTSVLSQGVAYVCCWGLGCERLHDIFDEAHVDRELRLGEERELMTTWHTDDSLAEALEFGVHMAWPATQSADRRVLVVSLDSAVATAAAKILAQGAMLLDET